MVKKLFVVIALGLMAFLGVSYFQRGPHHAGGLAQGPDLGGNIAYTRAGSIWLYTGGNQRQLTRGPQDKQDKRDSQPSFSPDGTQLVYTRFDEGFSDLYVLDIASPETTTPLTDHRPQVETGAEKYNTQALWAMQPAWSPEGDRIAFTSDVGVEYPALFSMNTLGNNSRRLETLNHGIQAVEHPTWSPDASKIAVANYVTDNGKGQVWSLNLTTGKWLEITNATDGAYDPAWSPDGAWIAFAMRNGTATNIYMVRTDAQQWVGDHPVPIQITTDGKSRVPAWSPDGTKLAYLSLKGDAFDLFAGDVKLGANGEPSLSSVQRLTEGSAIDATGGLSWGR